RPKNMTPMSRRPLRRPRPPSKATPPLSRQPLSVPSRGRSGSTPLGAPSQPPHSPGVAAACSIGVKTPQWRIFMRKIALGLVALSLCAAPALAQAPLNFTDVDTDASGELSLAELQ